MTIYRDCLFYASPRVLVGAALGVITARNPVHAALFLVLAFFTSAVLWLLLEAEFLAIVLVLVYVGAVMVLFLFVVMMLDINVEQMREGFTRYAPLGDLIALIVIVEIGSVVWVKSLGGDCRGAAPPSQRRTTATRARSAQLLYTDYVYPFELAAVILLVAIVAAIVLTHAPAHGPEGAGHRRAGRGAARGPRAHRQDAKSEKDSQ